MARTRVECYAGHRGAERPLRLEASGRMCEVTEIVDRWQEPEDSFFRVRASDGNTYLLRCTRGRDEDSWTLEPGDPGSAPSRPGASR